MPTAFSGLSGIVGGDCSYPEEKQPCFRHRTRSVVMPVDILSPDETDSLLEMLAPYAAGNRE